MKTIIALTILMLGTTFAGAQISTAPTPEWKVIFKVIDDAGNPVANAKASVGYLGTNQIAGLTDTNGVFIASHRDKSYGLGFVVTKDNYYTTRQTYEMGWAYQYKTNESKWNPTVNIVLKRIVKPIPMYAKSVNLAMPIFDKSVGFDFELGDWVGPYGKGVNSDIVFTAHFDKRSRLDFDYKLTVSFPKQGDGIQVFNVPNYYLHSQGSALRSNEEAPEADYQSEIVREHNERPDKILKYDNDPERIYIFRVRTKVDDRGNIVSAHYGKIYGDFMQFKYYLNPTPNSRNIEFDPKQNLMKNLKFDEEVKAP